jgi:formylglycine-generating enzyme required for sulfatase activity
MRTNVYSFEAALVLGTASILATLGCGSSGKSGSQVDGPLGGIGGDVRNSGPAVGGGGNIGPGAGGSGPSGTGSTTGAGGSTTTCGTAGMPCCDGNGCAAGGCCVAGICMSPGASCVGLGNGICSDGSCGTCGGPGQPCCGANSACTAPATRCMSGTCAPCGALGATCCLGTSGAATCTAAASVCSNNVCVTCGTMGAVCCPDSTCSDGCCASGKCVATCTTPDASIVQDAPVTTGGRGGSGAGGASGKGGTVGNSGGASGKGGTVGSGGTSSKPGTGGTGTGGTVASGGKRSGGSTGSGGGVTATGGGPQTGGSLGGAGSGGITQATGGITQGTGGTGGVATQPDADAGSDVPIVDPCGDTCAPGTFCNDARATCLPTDLEWIPIAGGSFIMGSDTAQSAHSNSEFAPAHQVSVPSFEMLRTEVTVAQYRACVDADACTLPDNPDADPRDTYSSPGGDYHPVNNVTALQAAAYCAFVGGRLPSEAEWEYADSNGGQGTYSWNYGGDTKGFDCDHAVIGPHGCDRNATWEVCSKPLGNTSHGLCDMTGNLAEWTADDFSWYDSNEDGTVDTPVDGSPYISPTRTDATGRVTKGGSYIHSVVHGTSVYIDMLARTFRQWEAGNYSAYIFGFRCARSAPPGGG